MKISAHKASTTSDALVYDTIGSEIADEFLWSNEP